MERRRAVPSGASAPPRRDRRDGSKLAENVADWIVADIAAQGWPVGEVLGSETELLERYGVSRAVFREAVRLLEHQQIGRMRRGPGGGLVVESPTVASVRVAVAVYLFFVRAGVGEVFDARLALEEASAELAPGRLTEADIAALRELQARELEGDVADRRELHALLARITGNPALELFVDLLNQSTHLFLPDSDLVGAKVKEASTHAHTAIIDAVLAGDDGLARRRMRIHLEAEAAYLRRRHRTGLEVIEALAADGRDDKRGERVARQIFAEVYASGWKVGAPLGSEAALMERYDVSRAVLREAVRVLEHHQVVAMRRGPGGGLFVAEPGVSATTEAVAIYIGRLGIEPGHLREVRTAVELAVVSLVVDRLDDQGELALAEAIELERLAMTIDDVEPRRALDGLGHDLHAVLARLAGNRVLELLALVLLRLTHTRRGAADAADPAGDARTANSTDATMRAHEGIVEAVVARDLELARHRLRRHLDAR